jgi:hypothetical protein
MSVTFMSQTGIKGWPRVSDLCDLVLHKLRNGHRATRKSPRSRMAHHQIGSQDEFCRKYLHDNSLSSSG